MLETRAQLINFKHELQCGYLLLWGMNGYISIASDSDSHEEHQLDDRRSPKEFTEGVDEEVIGQQAQLDQQHQGIAAGLKHGGPVTPHCIALC